MPAKIFCMASAKGGSGKTILTATFGMFLSSLGKKVLLIDTDAATNGLTLLYLKQVMLQGEIAIAANKKPKGIFESPSSNNPAEIVTLTNGVHLIPATYSFINTDNVLLDEYKLSLSFTLEKMKGLYDYIFLDAQSGSDCFAQYSMNRSVSDEVVIVSEYDPMSAAGVERLKGLLREDLTYVRTWVLLNKMLPDFVQSFSDFLEVAKYLNPIPWDADVVRAYARRQLALDLDNGNEHTLAIMQTVKTLVGENIASEIEAWTKERAAAIRQPLEDQYKDMEKSLAAFVEDRYRSEMQIEKRRLLQSFIPLAVIMTTISLIISYLEQFMNFYKSNSVFIALIFGTIIALYFSYEIMFKKFRKTPEIEIEQARMRRREVVLEEKLKKLESLRSADLETLVKSKKSSM